MDKASFWKRINGAVPGNPRKQGPVEEPFKKENFKETYFMKGDSKIEDFKTVDFKNGIFKGEAVKKEYSNKDDFKKGDFKKGDFKKENVKTENFKKGNFKKESFKKKDTKEENFKLEDFKNENSKDNINESSKGKSRSSFINYQESVLDVWDTNEDQLYIKDALYIQDHFYMKRSNAKRSKDILKPHQNSYRHGDLFQDDRNIPQNDQNLPPENQNFARDSIKYPLQIKAVNTTNIEKLKIFLNRPTDLEQLRKICWNGIPKNMRSTTWQLLLGYLPLSVDQREAILKRKRTDYWSFVLQQYGSRFEPTYKDTFHQIHIDVPRTNPLVPLFQEKPVQKMLERVLFLWALRHPASGYVQGINDLVTPFLLVFLQEYKQNVEHHKSSNSLKSLKSLESLDPIKTSEPLKSSQSSQLSNSWKSLEPSESIEYLESVEPLVSVKCLSKDDLTSLEADIFWCMCQFMSGIQENYVFTQCGIQNKITQLKELIQRVDLNLHKHLISNDVDYIQFAFRWFNNLLTRELSVKCILRLWDTYLAEGESFCQFLPYVCAAFLLHWRREVLEKEDFQGLVLLLQNLPTKDWDDGDVSLIVADAYRLKVMFADSPKHLELN